MGEVTCGLSVVGAARGVGSSRNCVVSVNAACVIFHPSCYHATHLHMHALPSPPAAAASADILAGSRCSSCTMSWPLSCQAHCTHCWPYWRDPTAQRCGAQFVAVVASFMAQQRQHHAAELANRRVARLGLLAAASDPATSSVSTYIALCMAGNTSSEHCTNCWPLWRDPTALRCEKGLACRTHIHSSSKAVLACDHNSMNGQQGRMILCGLVLHAVPTWHNLAYQVKVIFNKFC
jgi:hypothetical protein